MSSILRRTMIFPDGLTIMPLDIRAIKSEIDNSLRALAEQRGDTISSRIKPILYANLDRGRVQNFINEDISRVRDYVLRLAEGYKNLNPTIAALQIERSTKTWEPLFKQMVTWAYNFFLKKGFHGSIHTQEIATECATEAAMNILHAHFPYDTTLEPWVCVIVQNACRRFIRGATKKSQIPEQNIVDLEETLSNINDPNLQNHEFLKDLQGDLTAAIAKLSDARRQVIEYIYFQELSPAEIAGKMNKSIGAIYNLQFFALQDLRKILGSISKDSGQY